MDRFILHKNHHHGFVPTNFFLLFMRTEIWRLRVVTIFFGLITDTNKNMIKTKINLVINK